MSRVFRKGAVIGKAAVAMIVAGLLLYGAASLLKAESSETQTSVYTPGIAEAYRAYAESQLSAGNVDEAYDATVEMMEYVWPGDDTAFAAERIGKGMVNVACWPYARDLYAYSSWYGHGQTLKSALCGVARAQSEHGGNLQVAVEAARAVAPECRTDEKVTKSLMQSGDKLGRNRRERLAGDLYAAVAEQAPAGIEGLKAVRAMGTSRARLGDAAAAGTAARKLMRTEYRTVGGWAAAVDDIAGQMADKGMADEALALYGEMASADSSAETARTAACGSAAALIMNRRGTEAGGFLGRLAGPDGEITNPTVCGKLGAAHVAATEYAAAIPYFQKVAAANSQNRIGWGADGKVVECAIRVGADETATAAMDRMAGGYGRSDDRGRTFFDYARRYMIGGRQERASFIAARYASRLGTRDAAWLDAAQAAMACINGSEPEPLISQIVNRAGNAAAPEMLHEVGRAILYRGIEIEGDQAQAMRLFAAADKFFGYVTSNYPGFGSIASTWHKRADCAFYGGDFGAAIEYARAALNADPSYEYAGHCYIIIIQSYHAIGRGEPTMKEFARTELLKACQEARAARPDEKMVVNFAKTFEEGYAAMAAMGGGI